MAYYRHAFTGPLVVHRIGHLRYRVVFLPPELEALLGLGAGRATRGRDAAQGDAARGDAPTGAPPGARRPGRVRMTGEIADVPVEAAWQPAGPAAGGGYYVMVSPAVVRAAGLAVGDPVAVRFNVADPAAVTVPDELAAALRARRPAARTWAALTPGRRRALAAHVASARTAPTRERRVAQLVAALAAGEDPLARRPRPATS